MCNSASLFRVTLGVLLHILTGVSGISFGSSPSVQEGTEIASESRSHYVHIVTDIYRCALRSIIFAVEKES